MIGKDETRFFKRFSNSENSTYSIYNITMKNQALLTKIHIGYVLKSADVRTQVSSRYSENSSHTYLCTSTHLHAQLHTHAH